VNCQVLDPPFGFLVESLCLRSWLRVFINLGFSFLFVPVSFFEKKKKKVFTSVFLVKAVRKIKKEFIFLHLVW
jgi:hypothetical protein